ncbi:hypothetical protein DITRI_Ditri07aG0029000 [Diplodiscus trichospermus]
MSKENNITELTREDVVAALTLASLKHVKFDEKSIVELGKLRRKFHNIYGNDEQEKEEPNSVINVRNRNRVRKSTCIDDYQPPEIPPIPALAGVVGECSRPCEKQLTETDLSDNQTRLSLSKDHVRDYILRLLREGEDVTQGIPVTVYDSEGNEYSMRFVFWSSKVYVLTTTAWKTFYKKHGFQKDIDVVTVWMFRHRLTQKLCFAITSRRLPQADRQRRTQMKRRKI